MAFTTGVLASIIKMCSDNASTQAVVSILVASIDPNEKYGEKTESMRKAAGRILKCECDFPEPSFDSESTTDILALFPRITKASMLVPYFKDKVIPLINADKKRRLILALQDVVKNDLDIQAKHSETFLETVGMPCSTFVVRQSFDLASLLAGLFLYTVRIQDNKRGLSTTTSISLPGYWEDLKEGFMTVDHTFCPVNNVFEVYGLSIYTQRVLDDYKHVPTFISWISDFDFDEIFVCSNIMTDDSGRTGGKLIENATIEKLGQYAPRVMLHALGGNGKSMMLLYLLFNALERMHTSNVVPLYLCLRDYTVSTTSLIAFIVSQISERWPLFDARILISLLISNRVVLLLDGLDELKDAVFPKFKDDLDTFIKIAPQTQIIMTARPYANWMDKINGFHKAKLCGLTMPQALDFIERINLYPNDPNRFNKFRDLIKKEVYPYQRDFASNPLLLTAMMMVYHEDGEIPTKTYQFFDRVYDILSNSHDNTKRGYKRNYATGLDRRELKKYLYEFAYRAYKAQEWTLTMDRCEEIYSQMSIRGAEVTATKCEDFMTDTTKNLSLMCADGKIFTFFHHTFQEYLTAEYLSFMAGSQLRKLTSFFEKSHDRTINDSVFSMLYGMRPSQVEESIILPTLRNAFKKRTEAEEYIERTDGLTKAERSLLAGYWSYLLNQYPIIEYRVNCGEDTSVEVTPESAVVEFVLHDTKYRNENGTKCSIFHDDIVSSDIPDDRLVTESFYLINGHVYGNEQDHRTVVRLVDEGFEQELVYYDVCIDVEQVLRNPVYYQDVVECMEDPSFPLMQEYRRLRDHKLSLMRGRASSSKAISEAS